jgi:hypothetical protein
VLSARKQRKTEEEQDKAHQEERGPYSLADASLLITEILEDTTFYYALKGITDIIRAGNFTLSDFHEWKRKIARLTTAIQTVFEQPWPRRAVESAIESEPSPIDPSSILLNMNLTGEDTGRHVRPEPDAASSIQDLPR